MGLYGHALNKQFAFILDCPFQNFYRGHFEQSRFRICNSRNVYKAHGNFNNILFSHPYNTDFYRCRSHIVNCSAYQKTQKSVTRQRQISNRYIKKNSRLFFCSADNRSLHLNDSFDRCNKNFVISHTKQQRRGSFALR